MSLRTFIIVLWILILQEKELRGIAEPPLAA